MQADADKQHTQGVNIPDMDHYTETNYIDHDQLRTAGGKGRDDYFEVLKRTGLKCIRIPTLRKSPHISVLQRATLELDLRKTWRRQLEHLGEGDTLVLHSPVSEKFAGYPGVIREVRERGCRIIDIVFDLETFFRSDYRRFAGIKHAMDRRTEAALFALSDVVICHNDRMKDRLISLGVEPRRIVCVGAMDYLRDDEPASLGGGSAETRPQKRPADERFSPGGPVVFCGNLAESKSGFVYDLPEDIRIDLYGPGFTGRTDSNIRYRGIYTAFELMDIMEGSFGLVWDGNSSDTCKGPCGDYLRYNNPHKMSHYLASGMPVLVWDEAAMAETVMREGCGMCISSLRDIPSVLSEITDEEYRGLRKNAERVGSSMRRGEHIRAAVQAALELAHQETRRDGYQRQI